MTATDIQRARRTYLRLALALALFASLWIRVVITPSDSAAGTLGCTSDNFTREGAVMVVSDNIFESKMPDAGDASDVNRFVARLLEQTSSYDPGNLGNQIVPDIVLVQEVRKIAVVNVKNELNRLTGCTYSIAANASKAAFKWANPQTKDKAIVKDTAVLMNTNTMSRVSKGYVNLSYNAKFAAKGTYVTAKQAAWAQMWELDQGSPTLPENLLKVAAASVHYPRKSNFKPEADEPLKMFFSKKVADHLNTVLPDPDRTEDIHEDNVLHVMAGDMNNYRFRPGVNPKEETSAYELMTHPPYNYKDGVVEMSINSANPIDFLFSTGNFATADYDDANEGNHDETSPTFYSNHDLRWGVLEGLDLTPPTPLLLWRQQRPFSPNVGLRWKLESRDGGTGIAGYKVFRKVAGDGDGTYVEVGFVTHDGLADKFVDDDPNLVDGESYIYQVRVCDSGVPENCSDALTTTSPNGIQYNN